MGKAVDRLAQIMGAVMIALTAYVMWKAHPPVAEALTRSVWPEITSDNRSAFFLAVMTIVGGTVGGYISFAGAHRLLDSGVSGPEGLETATRGSVTGVLVATLMRCALFLAALGVVSQGLQLDGANPAGSVFGHAAGHIGTRVFGAVMWAAAITSVTGSAYTSISFLRTIHFQIQRNQRLMLVLFVICSTVVFLVLGRPVKLLILAGAVNGLILPAALAILLVAAHRQSIVGPYRNPRWLTFAGTVVVLVMTYLAAATLVTEFPKLLAPNSAP
jgi:Mn2+/Fe2+ NRAMP family transporter